MEQLLFPVFGFRIIPNYFWNLYLVDAIHVFTYLSTIQQWFYLNKRLHIQKCILIIASQPHLVNREVCIVLAQCFLTRVVHFFARPEWRIINFVLLRCVIHWKRNVEEIAIRLSSSPKTSKSTDHIDKDISTLRQINAGSRTIMESSIRIFWSESFV